MSVNTHLHVRDVMKLRYIMKLRYVIMLWRYIFADTRWPNSGLFLQNALVEYIGVYSDANKNCLSVHITMHLKVKPHLTFNIFASKEILFQYSLLNNLAVKKPYHKYSCRNNLGLELGQSDSFSATVMFYRTALFPQLSVGTVLI